MAYKVDPCTFEEDKQKQVASWNLQYKGDPTSFDGTVTVDFLKDQLSSFVDDLGDSVYDLTWTSNDVSTMPNLYSKLDGLIDEMKFMQFLKVWHDDLKKDQAQ